MLTPGYVNPSFVLYPLRLHPKWVADHQAAIRFSADQLPSIVQFVPGTGKERKGISDVEPITMQEVPRTSWWVAGVVYKLVASPAWLQRKPFLETLNENEPYEDVVESQRAQIETLASKYRQIIWHIVLLGTNPNGWLFVHATQESMGIAVRNYLVNGLYGIETKVLASDPPVAVQFPESALAAYFLRGQARQTELSGIHRRVRSKPDRKSLSGLDLRETFDPLLDQTYRLTSAVSLDFKRDVQFAGLAFKDQRVWSSKVDSIKRLLDNLSLVYTSLDAAVDAEKEGTGLLQEGYRLLATPVPASELLKAKGALDASFRPWTDLTPPLDVESTVVDETKHEIEWFADGEVKFVSGEKKGLGFRLSVHFAGRHLMMLDVHPWAAHDRICFSVMRSYADDVENNDRDVERFDYISSDEGLQKRLAVWYGTGHIVAEGSLTEFAWRDVLFESWKWGNITGLGYKPGLEKPIEERNGRQVTNLDLIGEKQSLLCFCANELPRILGINDQDYWAFCDDGSGETSDFGYYLPKERRLWLVHAKAAFNISNDRKLSVSAYEQVASQARKNVRYLDAATLAGAIEERKSSLPRIWWNGHRVLDGNHAVHKNKLVAELRKSRFLTSQTLVVLQPHVTKQQWESVGLTLHRTRRTPQQLLYKLLCTLLADLQITAQKFGYSFVVIGD